MQPITPNPDNFLLPEHSINRVYAPPRGQEDAVMPLPTLVTPHGCIVSQWQPNADDLALLNNGVPVTLVVWSGGVLYPVCVAVGGLDLRPKL